MEDSSDNFEKFSLDYVAEIKENSVTHVNNLNKFQRKNVEITDCIREAHELVDEVIDKSCKNVENIGTITDNSAENIDVPNIRWLSIQQFNIEEGLKKIDEFIGTWDRRPNWLYCIDFLCEENKQYSKRYRYRVLWSIPTRRKPIPRATAAVYFTFDVSTVKEKETMITVYYTFESSKLVHRPGFSRFREKWLDDIIYAKIFLMESVTF